MNAPTHPHTGPCICFRCHKPAEKADCAWCPTNNGDRFYHPACFEKYLQAVADNGAFKRAMRRRR